MEKINVYDFDKTILPYDSTKAFSLFCLRRHPRAMLGALRAVPYAALMPLRIVTKTRAKEVFYSFLTELPDVDGLRRTYSALRGVLRRPLLCGDFAELCRLLAPESALSCAGVGAALWALSEMRLIEADERGARLLPMEKRDPMDSAAVQTLLRLRAEGR